MYSSLNLTYGRPDSDQFDLRAVLRPAAGRLLVLLQRGLDRRAGHAGAALLLSNICLSFRAAP